MRANKEKLLLRYKFMLKNYELKNSKKTDKGIFAILEFLISENSKRPDSYQDALLLGEENLNIKNILNNFNYNLDVLKKEKINSDFKKKRFKKQYDVIFCNHIIQYQRNTGFFLDKIYDILSEEGYLIISGPKEPAEVFVEGQISTCILPVLIQNLIYAGFDCKKGKMMSLNLVENSFIVKKDKNFRLKERTETGYEWSKEHNNRSPIELKMGNTVSSSGLFLFNCEIWKIVIEKDKSGQYQKTIGLSYNLPKNYNPKEVNLNLNIPSNIRIFDQKLTELQSINHITI